MKRNRVVWLVIALALVIGLGALAVAVLTYQNSRSVFSENGFILVDNVTYDDVGEATATSVTQEFVAAGGTYVYRYPNMIRFRNADKQSIDLSEYSFIHYDDGSLAAFSTGVVFKFGASKGETPLFYDVSRGSLLQASESGYILDNGGTPVLLSDFIFKLSEDRFLIASKEITIQLTSQTQKTFSDYVEVSYVQENIIKLRNSEGVWYSIASDCVAQLSHGGLARLYDKEIDYGGEENIAFSRLVVNESLEETDVSQGVIPLFNIVTIDGESGTDGDSGEDGENGLDGENGTNGTIGAAGADGAAGGAGAAGTAGAAGGSIISDQPGLDVELPSYTLSDWKVRASSVSGTLTSIDDDMLRTDDTTVNIVNAETGETVATGNYSEMLFDFAFSDLMPNTEYRFIVITEYEVNGTRYTREFINKVFYTDAIGLTLRTEYAQQHALSFEVVRAETSTVSDLLVELRDENNVLIAVKTVSFGTGNSGVVTFDELDADTPYKAQMTQIVYDGSLTLESYGDSLKATTLKQTPTLGAVNVVVNKKNASFEVLLGSVSDPDGGIVQYTYTLYEAQTDTPVKVITATNANAIAFLVDNEKITRQTQYYVGVTVDFFDNEKTVEMEAAPSAVVTLEGTEFPSVRFVSTEIHHESIEGTLYIDMYRSIITIDADHPLDIVYKNSIGDARTITLDSDTGWELTDTTIAIPFNENDLRAGDTYQIAVYGYVDINDGNGMSRMLIGSALATTIEPVALQALLVSNAEDDTHAFSVIFSLAAVEGEDEAESAYVASTMEQLTFTLYAGSDDTSVPVATVPKVDTLDEQAYESSLKDKFYSPASITITEDFFDLCSSELTSINYTIKVSQAADYTIYENKIPIEDNTITVGKLDPAPALPSLTDAVAVSAVQNADLPSLGIASHPEYENDTIYGFKAQAYFDNGAKSARTFTYYIYDVVQYGVAVANGETPMPLTEGIKLEVPLTGINSGVIPTLYVVFEEAPEGVTGPVVIEEGKSYMVYESTLTYTGDVHRLSRGRNYYFSYTAELKLKETQGENGVPYYQYPEDYEAGTILRSRLAEAPYQEAIIKYYLELASRTAETWMGYVYDPDHTIKPIEVIDEVTGEVTASYYKYWITQNNVRTEGPEIIFNTNYTPVLSEFNAFTIGDTENGQTELGVGNFKMSLSHNLYVYSDRVQTRSLLDFYHEGQRIFTAGHKPTYEALIDTNKNRMEISVHGVYTDLACLAGLKIVAVDTSGEIAQPVVSYVEFTAMNDNGTASSATAYLYFADISQLSGKEVEVTVQALFDQGYGAGMNNYDTNGVFALQLAEPTEKGQYLRLPSEDGVLTAYTEANGSAFSAQTAFNGSQFSLLTRTINAAALIPVTIGEKGISRSQTFDEIVVKRLTPSTLNCSALNNQSMGSSATKFTFHLGTIIPTVNLFGTSNWMITPHLDYATVRMTLNGHQTGEIYGNKVYIELYKRIVDANNVVSYELVTYPEGSGAANPQVLTVSTTQTSYVFDITDLEPGTSYVFMIKANVGSADNYVPLYDLYYQNSVDVRYPVTTLSNFDISIASVDYVADSYTNKQLNVVYSLGEEIGFTLRFDFYKLEENASGVYQPTTTTPWLSHEKMRAYNIVTSYSTYNYDMETPFSWDPIDYARLILDGEEGANPLTVGGRYRLIITATPADDPGLVLAEASYDFNLNYRRSAVFGTTVVPSMDEETDLHTLFFTTATIDTDKSIMDSEVRVRFFDEEGTDITPPIYRGTDLEPLTFSTAEVLEFTLDHSTLPDGVVLQPSTNYTMCFYGVMDIENDGVDPLGVPLAPIGSYAYNELTNPIYSISEETLDESGMRLGTVTVSGRPNQTSTMRLFFNHAVNLNKISKIQYSVYSSSGHITFPLVDVAFTPTLRNAGTISAYYYFDLSGVTLTKADTYNIIVQYYDEEGIRIGTSTLSYNYEG